MNKTKCIKLGVNQLINHYLKRLSYSTNLILNKPNLALLMITSSCNLKCKQCNSWNRKIKGELKTEEWKKVISELKSFGSPFLSLTGGEPLLRKDLTHLVRFGSELGLRMGLNTNGVLLNKKNCQNLADSGVESLLVSLDSLDPTVHDIQRGIKGTHKRVLANITYLKDNYKIPKIQISTVLFKENLDGIQDLIMWVKKSEFYGIRFNVLLPNFWDPKMEKNKFWFKKSKNWPTDTKKVHLVINNIMHMKNKRYPILNSLSQLKLMKNYFTEPKKSLSSLNCMVGVNNIRIYPWGGVYLCKNMKEIGNVKNQTIKDIWYSKKAGLVRERINTCKRSCVISNCHFDEDLLTKGYNFLKYCRGRE